MRSEYRNQALKVALPRALRATLLGSRGDSRRLGFTLVEVLLSIALTAVITGIIGSLVQIYLTNQNLGRDRVKQTQLARALLNMIADDIRTVVRHQAFDSAGLSELLSGGQSGGGGTPAGGASAGGVSAGDASGDASSMGGGAMTGMPAVATLPPGIYGTSTSIEIDISRLPRPDEYIPREPDLVSGTVADLPSDIKTVSYFVQSNRTDGVRDPLATEIDIRSRFMNNDGAAGGLVRRSVDRSITQFAYEQGITDSLQRTGELLAPEVIALEFEYFDGAMWQMEWDSSIQGLPLVVRITLAMQLETKRQTNPVEPGQSILSLTSGSLSENGIEIYTTTTVIPGSQLLVRPQMDPATGDSGMGAMGL